jgi:hypothetical protein
MLGMDAVDDAVLLVAQQQTAVPANRETKLSREAAPR